jgi:CPA2 family monovalent cation:H+ antiporter-2
MQEISILRDLIVILGAALAVVVVLSRLRLPAIAGFIVAGTLLGPSGLAWIQDTHEVETLAEIGVALLLFTIGLELSPGELRRLGRSLVVGGGLQVALTIAAVSGLAILAGATPGKGVFLGFLVALSSTAIVLKGLAERGEVDAPHGRLTLGILVFQDLCVVPMILLVPTLGGHAVGGTGIGRALLTAAVVVALTLALARLAVPRALRLVTATRRRDLFILAVVLVASGIAWLTSLVGLSLALGAFLAGVVLAGSEYGHQALADTLSLRDIFTSLFFVSIGMLLDPRVVVREAPLVLGLFVAVLAGKTLFATLAGLALGLPLRVALLAGLVLAQVGEFSFVLANVGAAAGLLDPREIGPFFAASILTMLVSPFALRFGPGIALQASRLGTAGRGRRTGADEATPTIPPGHVFVLGYGVGGQLLVGVLQEAGVPVVALDLNAERVREASGRGLPVSYGDVTSVDLLHRAGLARAREVAVLLNDPDATIRAVRAARAAAPGATILARARYVADVPLLLAAGADEAVAQELEASFAIIERVMRERHAPRPSRAELRRRLGLEPPGSEPLATQLLDGLDVESVAIGEGDWIAGRSVAEAELRRRTGATLVAVSRGGATAVHPAPDDRLAAGDVLCLVGDAAQIEAARACIAGGPGDVAAP